MKFIRVAKLGEVREGCMKGVEADGQEVVLACVQGQVFAFDGICNHGLAYLEEGDLKGYEVVCPLHSGSFDIRSGVPTCAPAVDAMKVFPVRIENDEVLIDMDVGGSA